MFSFDMDEAGQLAADRAIREAMAAEFNIKAITLPSGKDPDELIRKNSEAWRVSVKEAKHVMQYYFDKTFAKLDIKTPEGKRGAAKIILPVIGRLRDKIEADHWLKKLAEKLDVGETALRDTLAAARAKPAYAKVPEDKEKSADAPIISKEERLSEIFLALLWRFPALLAYAAEKVPVEHVFGAANRMFYNNLVVYYNNMASGQKTDLAGNELDYASFKVWLNTSKGDSKADGQDMLLDKIFILGEKDFFAFDSAAAKNELIKIISSLRSFYYGCLARAKEKEIFEAEKIGDSAAAVRALEELTRLKAEKNLLSSGEEN
jgi:hypothetical protein